MSHLIALALAMAVDAVVGDPHWMPHPVRLMGHCIQALEGWLRTRFPATPEGERMAGTALVAAMLLLFGGGGWLVMAGLAAISPAVAFLGEVWLSAQLLAARQLQRESNLVQHALQGGDLAGARRAVSMIVGRDTQGLDEAGVARAAVETVAENTSDGVIAPLLFLALGGVPLGLAYKAVNTMDSMVGYRTPRYLHFGRTAARLDDAVNYIPARLTGLLLCGAACLLPGMSGQGAWRVYCRDRYLHQSPNSAHPEAACAGALGLSLGGNASYFGKVVVKPVIGAEGRPARGEDIARANSLMFAAELLAGLLLVGLPLLACII